MKKAFFAALLIFGLLAPLVFTGCTERAEGFAIYLTKNDVPVSQMEMLSHVELADTPIISMDDINTYTWESHEMVVDAEVCRRIIELNVPTSGKSFVVCVDKAPIYWGAFWTPLSSQSFDGVILTVYQPDPFHNFLKLELGYPGPDFFTKEDPRSNPLIMEALKKAGKLYQLWPG